MKAISYDMASDIQLELLNVLGYQYLQNGKPQRAFLIFEALQALQPHNSHYAFAAACACIRCNDGNQALLILDSLSKSQHDTAIAWLLRGQALAQLGRMAESARSMRLFIMRRTFEDSKKNNKGPF
jgi:predicted Zn-dependent protease